MSRHLPVRSLSVLSQPAVIDPFYVDNFAQAILSRKVCVDNYPFYVDNFVLMPASGRGKRQRSVGVAPPLAHPASTVLFTCALSTNLIQAWARSELPAVKVQFWAHQAYLSMEMILIGLN